MSEVRAISNRARANDFSGTGSENAVVWKLLNDASPPTTADAAGWVSVASYSRLTIQVETDDQANTFTIESRVNNAAVAVDLLTPTLVALNTETRIADKVNIENVAEVRLLENGTAATAPHKAFLYLL